MAMARIQEGDPAWQYNFPILWAAVATPLCDWPSSPSETITLYGGDLVHYIGGPTGYIDYGGYRWFAVRAYAGHDFSTAKDIYVLGYAKAVNLSTGEQLIKALGHYLGTDAAQRTGHVKTGLDVWNSVGTYLGTTPTGTDGIVNDDPTYPCLISYGGDNYIVPYPGQENTKKPYFICGQTLWFAIGAAESNGLFFIRGDISPYRLQPGVATPYVKREN